MSGLQAGPSAQAQSVKRQRTPQMDDELDGPSHRTKRLRNSDQSLDDIRHVDALLTADDGTTAERDDPMDDDPPSLPSVDKGKQRMMDESTTQTPGHSSAAEDDSRNAKVVGDLETELRCA